MTIILEGLDRTGKSSVSILLEKYFQDKNMKTLYGHSSKIDGKDTDEVMIKSQAFYSGLIANIKSLPNEVIIWDRAHIGEAVYSPIYRNYNGDYVFDIEKRIQEYDPNAFSDVYLFLLYDDIDNLIKRDDGKGFTSSKEQIKKELDLFMAAFDKSIIKNKEMINISKIGNEQDVFNHILHTIGER